MERLAAGEDAQTWRAAIMQVLSGGGEVLKVDGEARVVAAGPAVFKIRPIVGLSDLLRARLGLGREERQWRGAQRLASAGVPTARPLAIARGGRRRVLALERLDGRTLLDHLASRELAPRLELALAGAAGAVAGRAYRAGVVNRDAKPSNWIVTACRQDAPGLAMIDPSGVRRSRARIRAVGMLASMVIEAIGVGATPRRGVLWAGLRAFNRELGGSRADAKAWWRDAARAIADHGDPRPRVNPLA